MAGCHLISTRMFLQRLLLLQDWRGACCVIAGCGCVAGSTHTLHKASGAALATLHWWLVMSARAKFIGDCWSLLAVLAI